MKQKIIKKCKHNWKPFGNAAVTSISEYTPSLEIKYFYHWYCTKCKETQITTSGWRRI